MMEKALDSCQCFACLRFLGVGRRWLLFCLESHLGGLFLDKTLVEGIVRVPRKGKQASSLLEIERDKKNMDP
jgi:hypothetical protein